MGDMLNTLIQGAENVGSTALKYGGQALTGIEKGAGNVIQGAEHLMGFGPTPTTAPTTPLITGTESVSQAPGIKTPGGNLGASGVMTPTGTGVSTGPGSLSKGVSSFAPDLGSINAGGTLDPLTGATSKLPTGGFDVSGGQVGYTPAKMPSGLTGVEGISVPTPSMNSVRTGGPAAISATPSAALDPALASKLFGGSSVDQLLNSTTGAAAAKPGMMQSIEQALTDPKFLMAALPQVLGGVSELNAIKQGEAQQKILGREMAHERDQRTFAENRQRAAEMGQLPQPMLAALELDKQKEKAATIQALTAGGASNETAIAQAMADIDTKYEGEKFKAAADMLQTAISEVSKSDEGVRGYLGLLMGKEASTSAEYKNAMEEFFAAMSGGRPAQSPAPSK